MNKKLKLKIHESLSAVIPITLIVLALGMTVVPMELSTLMLFLAGAALGADMAMMPIGEQVGTQLTRSKRLWLIVAACFVIGVIITVAEPDLQVLANQVASIPNEVLIWTVALGVGIFTAIAVVRILFHISLAKMLTVFYSLLFLLSFFTPSDCIHTSVWFCSSPGSTSALPRWAACSAAAWQRAVFGGCWSPSAS